jgi:hypothetical protein
MNRYTAKPAARMFDTSAAFDGGLRLSLTGLVSGTKLATKMGWRSVEAISAGDEVLTFDEGLKPVVRVQSEVVTVAQMAVNPENWPVYVPAGAIGNQTELWLLPEQLVVIENDAAEAVTGDAFAPIPAQALVGLLGIERRRPEMDIQQVTLFFEDEQVVFSNSGAMFHCPAEADIVIDLFRIQERRYYMRPALPAVRHIANSIAKEFGAGFAPAHRIAAVA